MSFDALPCGAEEAWSALLEAATPPPELTVSQWADLHRYISAASGARFPGKWRTDRAPYTREVMDCMGVDHPARSVWAAAGAQAAKSQ